MACATKVVEPDIVAESLRVASAALTPWQLCYEYEQQAGWNPSYQEMLDSLQRLHGDGRVQASIAGRWSLSESPHDH